MSTAKCQGGLGFRSIHGFNIALLGKHCWNFVQQPDSLVARVFKARYFADTHFLKYVKGSRSSFIWEGIYTAKETLQGGFRWIIGDGEDVVVVQDSWLRRKCDYRVQNDHMYQGREEKVAELFLPGTKQWNEELV